jgi:L,D-peptidoglycan transpeptidase YkuD (ErfK/YbiS/YcfS/YnhG family)
VTEAVLLPEGPLRFRGENFRAAIGRAGVSAFKLEGDGATPLGLLPLRRVLYRADRLAKPRAFVPVEPIARQDGWCDDPAHKDYNRAITLPHPAGHEELWRSDGLYDVIGVLGWNDAPVERGRGSAIFLHVATPDYAPTAGCVALALPELLAIFADGLTAVRVLQT